MPATSAFACPRCTGRPAAIEVIADRYRLHETVTIRNEFGMAPC